ncbi:MAG TPA: glycosyltransferase family 2 protein [Anaerolineaceae bacterium]|jgi:dolichol-phosphate mannosyltransferase|nr:glycosyltransferase family 2 protein [Anaerolineales bacterium]HOG58762.1 glycosyltransferase family 2 protein [Anaerolineaceae bacterium]HOR83380.1 glycosyltransferase family 2 protein [Anaerolineaceae bacterium]HPL42916.1 glycosyltransferase family 2 protein [Anaerolineaceae bacterium]HPY33092.1 glycosyltransferase family 2 protein [Anaerolineaceae bacterium]
MTNPVFTIIAPIFNELENLPLLYARVREELDKTEQTWELIMVDDGSRDGSTEVIRKLAASDERVRPVIFARNFGHQIAVSAGLDYSRGDAVIIIDSDLQDPPEVIGELIAKWREGFEVVYAVRTEREGETKFKTQTAALFYRMIDRITDVKIPLDTGDFRLMDRKVVNVMVAMREHNRFLRGMSAWTGFRQIGVGYKRKARHAGVTKYPLKKMLRLAMNAVTGFSMWPLQLATRLGAALGVLGLLAIPVVVILHVVVGVRFHGLATLAILMTLLSALILVFLGVIGEYLGRVYDEAKNRPLYIVAEGPRQPFNPIRLDLPADANTKDTNYQTRSQQ